jgi:hypothetical protein
LFTPSGSDNSSFWFEGISPGQWDGDVVRACEAAVDDWKRFQGQADGILASVIADPRLRHRLANDLADTAFPEAFSPACQLWLKQEEAVAMQTLHQPLAY